MGIIGPRAVFFVVVRSDDGIIKVGAKLGVDMHTILLTQAVTKTTLGRKAKDKIMTIDEIKSKIEAIHTGDDAPVSTSHVVHNADDTYSVIDNGEEVVASTADEAAKFVKENE